MRTPKCLAILLIAVLLSCSSEENAVAYWEDGSPKVIIETRYEGPYLKRFYPNGNIAEEGLWIDSIKEQSWKTYYESGGLKSKINYREGKKFGRCGLYHPNGQMSAKGNYNEFEEKDGEWVYFNKNGSIQQTGAYENGLKIGNWREYEAGHESFEEAYFENPGEKQGARRHTDEGLFIEEHYSNGALKYKGQTYKDSKNGKYGLWAYYYENGAPKSKGTYEENHKIGEWTYWYANGQLLAQGHYYDGKPEEITVLKSRSSIIARLPLDNYERNGIKTGKWKYYKENGKLIAEVKYVIKDSIQRTKIIRY